MTDLPELPDSDDPFAILGVAPPVSERDLRRAYVRKSKIYRPERAPEQFQRVRAAYEDALTRLNWTIYDQDEGDGDHGGAVLDEPAVAAKQGDQGDTGGAQPDGDGVPIDWRAIGESASEATDVLIQALHDGRPVAEQVVEKLSLEQLVVLATRPELDWAMLRKQPARWAALELFSLHLQALLMAGERDRAVASVSHPDVLADSLEVPELEHVAVSVALHEAFYDQERSEALVGRHADQSDMHGGETVAFYRDVQSLIPAWTDLREQGDLPEALVRFVELFASVGYAYRHALVDDVGAALERDRFGFVRALDRISAVEPQLVRYLYQITDGLLYGEDRDYAELADKEQAYIAEAMNRVALDDVTRRQPLPWVRWLMFIAIAALAAIAVPGYTGLFIGAAVLVIAGFNQAFASLGSYMHVVRDRIADAVVETGLSPDRMLEWATFRRGTREPDHPFGVDADYSDDMVLHVLARLSRLSKEWRAD